LVVTVGGSATAWTLRRPLFLGNFGVVDPGRVYRYAQPQPDDWPYLLETVRLASVVNLRGGSMKDPWYAAEADLASKGIDVYELPMNAEARPRRHQLLALLDLFDRVRYPLLIHCKAGADRTGLASGLYRLYRLGEPPEKAIGSLTIAHGHFAVNGTQHMDEPFHEYEAWLREKGLTHTPAQLREWIMQEYRDPGPEVQFAPLAPRTRVDEVVRREAR
jgi:hypothetical protein